MNRFLILSLLFLSLYTTACAQNKGGQKKKKQSAERVIPAELAAAYRIDATRLAARELMTSRSSTEAEGDLPKDRIEYFYGLLTKIHWMQLDSANIPDLSAIHTFPNPDLRKIQVTLSADSDLMENWSQGITTSHDLYLNQLLSRYGISLENFRKTSTGAHVTLVANRDVSTFGLSEALRHNPQIKSASPETMMGDGNNIEWGGEGKNQLALRYSIGAGDCPSGCINRKFWIFYVSQEGVVTYMGTRGEIPAELEPKE